MASILSPGTERVALDFGRRNLLGKARSRPDLVRQVLDKARRDGLIDTARAALARLEEPAPTGYACAGTVIAVGEDTGDFVVGDRVACAGSGYATHAEVNYIPRNLAVPVPRRRDGSWLGFDEASFATLGAIALHAVRLGHPGAGDRSVVIGLGLVGILVAQVLRAHGCVVIGVEPSEPRRRLAVQLGVDIVTAPDEAIEQVRVATGGVGADLILVTASGENNEPVTMAGEIARDRATVVAVGATRLDLPRRIYYRKELSVIVSRSYGPGRYDPAFEEQGRGYPPGYVRWTERENLRAFLDLVARDQVRVDPLITHRVPLVEAERAYGLLDDSNTLGVVLRYSEAPPSAFVGGQVGRVDVTSRPAPAGDVVGISVLGAGVFARSVLLPTLARVRGISLRGVVTGHGATARATAARHGFHFCATDPETVWEDRDTHAVIIATRHDSHASLVEAALAADKAVFVEKPLCVTPDELGRVVEAFQKARTAGRSPVVMVGFNRRFAPAVRRVREALASIATPLAVQYRVNAGRLPSESWIVDPAVGGGRIVSEVCHFIDLTAFLVGSPVTWVFARSAGVGEDDVMGTLGFAGGSLATIGYFSAGDRTVSKERIEVFGGGAVAIIDDFRRASVVRNGRRRRLGWGWSRPDKGHRQELEAYVQAIRTGGPSPVPFEDAVRTTRATLALRESLSRGAALELEP